MSSNDMPTTLAAWLTHLESLHPKTIALGLERVVQVKQRLGLSPSFPIVTVGGTNGKGSVCAMLESILHAAGYRVGCYTSPHLLRYNERVRINMHQASDAELCSSFEEIERVRADTSLTYFEFGTLAAVQSFVRHGVEIAILEVGLGGRLDAVNAFDGSCAIVSSVGIDHTQYLGETREQIAFEKAGIFRSGRVSICADPDVPVAMRDHAKAIRSELWCIGDEFGFTERHQGQWDYYSKLGSRHALPYPALRGLFQLNNASAALAALDVLNREVPVSMQAVRRGLVEVQLAGRFQVVPGKPMLILDVAHNPHAARSLAQNLASLPRCGHTWAIFGILDDKDVAGVVEAVDEYIDSWVVSELATPRSAGLDKVMRVLSRCKVRGDIMGVDGVPAALHYAYDVAGENDRIIAFGSFHTVAEVMTSIGLSVYR
jgi:dihydrofolate synthase/folylpolyglutamate synthase